MSTPLISWNSAVASIGRLRLASASSDEVDASGRQKPSRNSSWYSGAMSSERKETLTAEEYLALERKAATRSEYLDGDMVAMTGGSRERNLIVTNLAGEFRARLKGRPCEVYAADMRVKVSQTGLYTYPDIVIVCG